MINSDIHKLTLTQAKQIIESRQATLQKLRPLLSLGCYHQLAKKIKAEQHQFEMLLNESEMRKKALSRYTFVLHPGYFEQKLWKA